MQHRQSFVRPPRISEWILRWLYPDRGAHSLAGDLSEAYQILASERGRSRARWWYRGQLLRLVPTLIKDFVYWRVTMLSNYIKIALRHMRRQKGYSFINITGLALGMACTLLILLWVRDELSFDRFHEYKKDLYRVTCLSAEEGFFGSPAPFAPAVKAEIPEVLDAVRVRRAPRFVFRRGDLSFYEDNGISADPSFFSMFSFPMMVGDPAAVFEQPLCIVLSERMARKYFGDENPLEGTIEVEGRAELRVVGIMEDVPSNSHLRFDYVIPHKLNWILRLCGMRWGDFNFWTYIRTAEMRDEGLLIEKLNTVSEQHGCPQIVSKQLTFSIQPLEDIYLNPLGNYDMPLGDKRYVYLFSLVAFFILAIACINFINLSTARSERRAREVGLRKVVGADRAQLIKQFFGESILLAFFALVLALVVVYLFIPLFNGLTGKSLELTILSLEVLSSLIVITGLVGMMAGFYPALYLSSFQPVDVLRSSLGFRMLFTKKSLRFIRKGTMRRILVVTQFTLSIILILGTTTVYNQLRYIQQKSWNSQNSVVLHIPVKENIGPRYDVVKNELLRHPSVVSVAVKDVVPTELRNNTSGVGWAGKTPDQDHIHMETTRIGFDYFDTMDMDIVAGRGFSKDFPGDVGSGFILNEEAVRAAGLEDPVGKRFRLYGTIGTIVGVVQDTYFQTLRRSLRPTVFHPFTNLPEQTFGGVVLIKVQNDGGGGSLREVIGHIEGVWTTVNAFAPFEYHFLNETIDAQYRNEQRLGRLFSYFAFLAVVISCLGLFGLASFVAEQKTKEIGIRKALGASTRSIVLLLSRDFTRWVLAANLIAWPVAWYTMSRWLQNFAYRSTIAWWSFLVAGAAALLIAWATVSLQTYKAARLNPVDSLRYE